MCISTPKSRYPLKLAGVAVSIVAMTACSEMNENESLAKAISQANPDLESCLDNTYYIGGPGWGDGRDRVMVCSSKFFCESNVIVSLRVNENKARKLSGVTLTTTDEKKLLISLPRKTQENFTFDEMKSLLLQVSNVITDKCITDPEREQTWRT